mmetsp:Transcript_76059/g.122866  ORF Transcript_76059/g.122866 Transcript_76059/m.122866 type:complete len:84 (+) Transcript_76059:1103-1354(+)
MRDMLVDAGFVDIQIVVKEDAAAIIKDWMPGSGAEKYITSAYVTAKKPMGHHGIRDNVRADQSSAQDVAVATAVGGASCGPGA